MWQGGHPGGGAPAVVEGDRWDRGSRSWRLEIPLSYQDMETGRQGDRAGVYPCPECAPEVYQGHTLGGAYQHSLRGYTRQRFQELAARSSSLGKLVLMTTRMVVTFENVPQSSAHPRFPNAGNSRGSSQRPSPQYGSVHRVCTQEQRWQEDSHPPDGQALRRTPGSERQGASSRGSLRRPSPWYGSRHSSSTQGTRWASLSTKVELVSLI